VLEKCSKAQQTGKKKAREDQWFRHKSRSIGWRLGVGLGEFVACWARIVFSFDMYMYL
jgi:hypothetical protein